MQRVVFVLCSSCSIEGVPALGAHGTEFARHGAAEGQRHVVKSDVPHTTGQN